MAIDRRHIGVASEPRTVEVEKWHLKFFAKATGETDPVYFDEAAAKSAGHPAILAPPTFVQALNLAAPAKRGDVFSDIGVDVVRALHAEQRFTHHRPIYAGDFVTLATVTVDIYEKKGGALEFIVQDTRAVNQFGQLCVEQRGILAVRNS
jgi:acyl dehydratase